MVGVNLGTTWGENHEPHVMMEMGVLLGRSDLMNIEVHGHWPYSEAHDPGLLGGLSQGHGRKVGITVGMTTGLHPNLQLRMEKDQGAFQVRVHNQRTAGEVARTLCSIKRQRTLGDKQPHTFPCLSELGVVDRSDHRPGITHAVRCR